MASLDLDAISFAVETKQLDEAITKLSKLETSLGNLSKPLKETTIASEKLAQAQAKTAQAQSKAEEAANKVAIAQARLEKATSSATTSQGKLNKATDESLDKAKALQEKLANTYKDLSQGYTKGESSVLNYARSIGIAEDALKPFQEQLKLIGKLSTDPFDSAIGSIRSITKEFEMMNHRTDLAGKGIVLSAKQLKEYSRVADEVAAKITANGLDPTKDKGLADYTKGVERLQAKYLGLASTVSDARQVEVANQQAIKDTAKANDYLTREMLRAEAALAGLNENMNISSSNRLLRFKEALSAAGVEAGQAALALQKYEAVLKATDTASASKKTKNRKEELEYLARATSVQLGDIGVSLAGGQNPLIVMIQQGDQLRGVLNQVGGDAKEMQAAMSSAFRQIVVGFVDVGKALGQFVTGAFVDASEALANFIGNSIPGIKTIRKELQLMSDDSNAVVASIGKFGTALINVVNNAAIGSIMAITVAITSAAVALYQLGKEQTDIAQANAQFGGAFGASTKEVIAFNSQLSALNVTSSQASQIFIDIAKSGNIGKESFVVITKAAADFEKYVGGKAVDAVKVFSETVKDPVKGLTEFGIQTGFVSKEQVTLVKTLLESGKAAEAQQVAIDVLKEGYKKMADESKNSMSNLDLTVIELKSSMSKLWDEFKNSQLVNDLSNVFRLLMGWASGVSFTISALLINIRAIPAAAAGAVHDLANVVSIAQGKTKSMLSQVGNDVSKELDSTAQSHADFIKRMLENNKEFDASSKQSNSEQIAGAKALSELKDRIEKAEGRTVSRQEYINKGLEDARKVRANAIKDSEQSAEALKLEARYAEALGKQWDKAHKQKKDPTESFFASSIKTFAADTAKAVGIQEQYTKAQVDFLKIASDPRWLKLTEDERAAIAVKAEAAAKEEVLAKAYLATKKAEEDAAKATSNIANEIEKLIGIKSKSIQFQQMLDEQLMLGNITFEQSVKAINDYSAALDKISSDKAVQTSKDLSQSAADRLALIKEESEDLKLQKSIYGFFTVDQKRILEQAKVTRDLRKEILGIEKLTTLEIDKGGITAVQAEKHKAEAYEAAAEKRKNIEQAAALETYKAYHDAFADAIETGLLQSGKEAGVNLRKFLETELLRKPFRVFINAAVDLAMSSLGFAGSAASGAGSSMLGAAGASFVGSSSALSLGAQSGFGALLNGGGFEAIGSAFTAITEGTMASFAAGLGTLAGVLGPIAGVAMLLSSLDDSGTYHTGGLGSYSLAGGSATGTAVKTQGLDFNLASKDYQASTEQASVALAKGIVEILNSTAKTFGNEAGYYAATAFADDTSKDGAWGALMVKLGDQLVIDWKQGTDKWPGREFADGEAGVKEYSAAIAKDMRDLLVTQTPDWADAMLNALGEAPTMENLTSTVNGIIAIASALDTLKLAGESFLSISNEMADGLVNALGTDTASILSNYYSNFYTEAQKTEVAMKKLTTEFNKANIKLPETREDFKAMVDEAVRLGNTDVASFLLKISSAYAAAVPESSVPETIAETSPAYQRSETEAEKQALYGANYVDQAASELADSVAKLAKRFADTQQSLAETYRDLTIDLVRSSGDEVAAREMERTKYISQYNDLTEAERNLLLERYDANIVLKDQIANISKEKQIEEEKLGLEKQILQLQGNTSAIRKLELALISPSNRALQERIWALEDEQAAVEKSNAAIKKSLNDLVAYYDKVNSEAVAATDKAYAVLEKSIQKEIEVLEKERTTLDKAVSSKEDFITSIKSIFDVLKSSLENLYSSVTSTSKTEVSNASNFIAAALATAKATGALPDSNELSKAISLVTSDLDATQFKSKFEADKQKLLLANMLKEFKTLSSNQLTDAEKQLQALKDQLLVLEDQKKALNDQLTYWKDQIDIARGTYTEAVNIKVAIDNLTTALLAEKTAVNDKKTNLIQGSGSALYDIKKDTGVTATDITFTGVGALTSFNNLIGQGGTVEAAYNIIKDSGFTLAQAESILGVPAGSYTGLAEAYNLPKFASGGLHTGGVRLVGEGGPELEVTGPARYYSASQTANMLSGDSDKEELEMLRYEVRAVAQHTSKLTKQIERLIVPTANGEALQTSVAA